MIEQQANQLTLTFPSEQAATAFATFLRSLMLDRLASATSSPASAPPDSDSGQSTSPSLPSPPSRSQHTVLTEERQEALFNQRAEGQTQHQRLLRAQTTLRDGVLPFSRPGQSPPPSGQPSPRQRAAAEGGFADGSGEQPEAARRAGRSRLRPVPSQPSPAK
jgi:hypothetical protein